MKIRKYLVKDMNEAFTKIRYELGNNAVIINQKKVKKPGIKGFFSKKLIEVTAAAENAEMEDKHTENKSLKDSLEVLRNAVNTSMNLENDNLNDALRNKRFNHMSIKDESMDQINNKLKNNEHHDKIKNEFQDGVSQNLLKEMSEMKNLLNSLVKGENSAEQSSQFEKQDILRSKLIDLDIDDEVIDYILKEINNSSEDISEEHKINGVLENILKVSEMDMSGKIVFIGPTGVGKTTTIAKLAGRLSLMENKKVGLITVDTYRIGAVEQLKTYADIMNLPFRVVFNISDMEEAVASMEHCDVVLIDTTGRSSKNFMQISELRAFIDKVNTENINLVISCTTKNKDVLPIIEGYKKLNFNNVIITKLDETTTYGSILNIAYHSNKEISFITTGQNVPDDIKVMNSEKLRRIVLGEDNIC